MCVWFVDLFNCRVAKPRLAGRLVFYLCFFYCYMSPSGKESMAGEAVAMGHTFISPSFFRREEERHSSWEGDLKVGKIMKKNSWCFLSWANICPSLS